MHITGIIAEYNPLHLGHQYHIEQTKALTGADYIITVLSGDFVQRGLPAVTDKHTRTRMALEAGSDLVLELPVPYSLSSGEGFGFGGISLLHGLGCVDTVSFGTEAGETDKLMKLAKVLTTESADYKVAYQTALKQGFTHPAARLQALTVCYPELDLGLLDGHSNNMLALEYCKALYRLDSPIQPVTVKRCGQRYLDTAIADAATTSDITNATCSATDSDAASLSSDRASAASALHFASATAIRDMLNQNGAFYVNNNSKNTEHVNGVFPDRLQDELPSFTANILQNKFCENALLFPDDFSNLLHYRLLTLSADELSSFWEVTPDLANKINNRLPEFEAFTQFANLLWTKDLTYARVCRCLMHILLDIKENTWDVHQPVPYARVLGFRRDSAALFSVIKQNSAIPLVTKVADAEKLLSCDAYKLFEADLKATHIFDSVLQYKSGQKSLHEAQKQIVII